MRVLVDVMVLDGALGGPEFTVFYDMEPLATLYAHGCIDRRFLDSFVRVATSQIRQQGGRISAKRMTTLVHEAIACWQRRASADDAAPRPPKTYTH